MAISAGVVYFGSRSISAAVNLVSMVLLSRLAGADEYGQYLLIFAWSLVLFGLAAQWMRYAYFGTFKPERIREYVGSLYYLLGVSLACASIIMAIVGVCGFFNWSYLLAVLSVVCGLAIYEIAFEVARTLLDVFATATSMLLRSILTLTFGAATLWFDGGAVGLAFAIGAAHGLAALPSIASSRPLQSLRLSPDAAANIVRYGWPLLLSFGVYSAGTVVDRFVIAHEVGAAALASYGVVSDLMRQSFSVLGEIIILSLVTIAKHHANAGDSIRADEVLRIAFNATLAAAFLGAAFYIVFGPIIIELAFSPEFVAPIRQLIPILAIRSAILVLITYYFAQVIYFVTKTYIDLAVAVSSLLLSTVLLLIFVPTYGVKGAAVSMTATTISTCLIYIWLGRKLYRLPIDSTGFWLISSLTIAFVMLAQFVFSAKENGALPVLMNAGIFTLLCCFVVYWFGFLTVKWPPLIREGSLASCRR